MVKRFFNYIKLSSELLSNLHKHEGISLSFLWLDSVWALLRHGCLIRQYTYGEFYKVNFFKMGNVITQRRLEKIIRTYNDVKYIHYLSNKNEFNLFFQKWVKRKWLWSLNMTEQQFTNLLKDCNRLFVKPLNAQEGQGIWVIENTDLEANDGLFEKLKKDNIIIEEAIQQHPSMSFNNVAVNTIRIITCLDAHGIPHILRASLRVGIGKSIVDNFSAGGALYNIDIDSGCIDNKGIGHDYFKYIFHPGTNICMLGFQIPNWDNVIKNVCQAASMIPNCRFIGWDVAVTCNGIELIEGNHNPGLFTMESLGTPFAYDEALRLLNL